MKFESSRELTLYFREVESTSHSLTREEESVLIPLAKSGDSKALNRVVNSCSKMVVKTANKYMGQGVPVMDLVQEGNIGTIEALKRFAQLSSDHDPRITGFGRFLRKSRLDELPQFFNVVLGEMSLVGPRPERQHYIDLISERAPHYKHLQKVRPGITSWGQVKFGYAENVEQMVQRLRFDLIYIENMSIALDIKMLFYTVLTVLRGRGK